MIKIFSILFVAFLVMAIVGCIKADNCKTYFRDKVLTVIAWIGIIGTFIMFITMITYGNYTTKDKKYEVCSLTTSTQTKEESAGLFVLGVGAYNSQSKKDTNYYFYKKEKQGGWKLTKVNAYDVVVFEDEDKKPYYVEVNKSKKDYDELHLPKNTIKKDINKINITELIK